MDIPVSSVLTGTSAIQALLPGQGTSAAEPNLLTALVGQDLDLLLLAVLPDSVQLQLPSGQSIVAQGELPYPQGTQLRVRVLPPLNEAGLRLQTLEARPPAAPALLAPLLQGEATFLVTRLTQADPPQELLPLIQLMNLLAEEAVGSSSSNTATTSSVPIPLPSAPASAPVPSAPVQVTLLSVPVDSLASPMPASPAVPSPSPTIPVPPPMVPATAMPHPMAIATEPPTLPQPASLEVSAPKSFPLPAASEMETMLKSLPEKLVSILAEVSGSDPSAPIPQVARDLVQWVRRAVDVPQPNTPPDASVQAAQTSQAQIILAQCQSLLLRHPELPPDQGDTLLVLIRNLLGNRATPEGAEDPKPTPSKVPLEVPTQRAVSAPSTSVRSEPAATPSRIPVLEQPATWETWVRGTIKTLGNPTISPREAPFHIVQGREGTAFFEIPLPHAPGKNLQIWVESDAPEDKNNDEGFQRVMLGLEFTRLGETRLGLARNTSSLQVCIWSEHAELLEPERSAMEAELKTLGRSVDLRIRPLSPDAPSLRAIVAGPSLQALV